MSQRDLFENVAEGPKFIERIISSDETWVYEYDVENDQQYCRQWHSKNESKP